PPVPGSGKTTQHLTPSFRYRNSRLSSGTNTNSKFTIPNSKLFKTVPFPSSVLLPLLPAFLLVRVRRPMLHRSPGRTSPRSDDPGWNRGCRPSIDLIFASNFLTGNDTPEQRPG